MENGVDLVLNPLAVPLMERIDAKSIEMKSHRVFGLLHTIDDLHTFMSWHAFAVWDFMSLVKRLQIEFTSLNLPWVPPRNPEIARLINEIVLGEETDVAHRSGYLSHYELYIAAMEEVGASTHQIMTFTDLVASNMPIADALKIVEAPAGVREFVTFNVNLAAHGSVEQVLGSFVFGREDAIPDMFQRLLSTWKIKEEVAPIFVFYLKRHIQLDADEHGPAAMRMLKDQVAGDTDRLLSLLEAALAAIEQRIKLWDSLATTLESQHAVSRDLAEAV